MAEVPTSRPAMANGVSVPSENQSPGYSAKMQLSWTEDLPVCCVSGVGTSTNKIYRDGRQHTGHECEDRNFHFRHDGTEGQCYLYGVFDGHKGSHVANFAAQRMPAEVLLGQLHNKIDDIEIHNVLRQTFMAVENAYFASIVTLLAEKTALRDRLLHGITAQEALSNLPDISTELQLLDHQLSGGTTATLALIYHEKLYVANVGNSRALLVRSEMNGNLTVAQLTVDHSFDDPGEIHRLTKLGMDVDNLRHAGQIGNTTCTRCIGDCSIKGGYRDIDYLSDSSQEPVIVEPFIYGGIPVDSSCSFLILMSDGLCHSLIDATQTEQANADIASMVANEFFLHSTPCEVAQAVVDRIVCIHHEAYMTGNAGQELDDITLIVRPFNFPLHSNSVTGIPSPRISLSTLLHESSPDSFHYSTLRRSCGDADDFTNAIHDNAKEMSHHSTIQPLNGVFQLTCRTPTDNLLTTDGAYVTGGVSTTSSADARLFSSRREVNAPLHLDEDGKIKPYVDFSQFYDAMRAMTEEEQSQLMNDLRPKSMHDPILEEIASLTLTDG